MEKKTRCDNKSDKNIKESQHFQLLSLGNWKNCDSHERFRKVRKGSKSERNTGDYISIQTYTYIYIYIHTHIYKTWQSVSHSFNSNSLQPHGLQPCRLLCPWNSPGKNTGILQARILEFSKQEYWSRYILVQCSVTSVMSNSL